MRTAAGVAIGLITGTALGWAFAWQFGGRMSGGSAGAAGGKASSLESSFELDGNTYAESEFPLAVQTLLYDARREAFADETGLVSQLAVRLALAREREPSATLADVPGLEALVVVPEPTEAEARKVFEENRARLPAQASFEQVKGEVVAFIKAEKFGATVHAKVQELKAQGRLRLHIEEPLAPAVSLPIGGRPVRGDLKASNVLVEAFDYLCPHCQAIKPELDALLTGQEKRVRFVTVNYSLKPEGLSGALARGAYCASLQGDAEFWRFHDEAFAAAKRLKWSVADSGGEDAAIDIARTAKLDVETLRACVASDAAKEEVTRTNAALAAAGMTGTPTFFLNGRKISHQGTALRELIQRLGKSP